MTLNKATAWTLRGGIALGMVLIVIGLILTEAGMGDSVLYAGILVLIISPFASIVVSLVSLVREHDTFWAGVALILLIVTAVGVIISLRRQTGRTGPDPRSSETPTGTPPN